MPFDPNAFISNQAQPEKKERRPVANGFDPAAFIGDISTVPQPTTYEPSAEGMAQTAALGVGGAAATAYGMSGDVITPRMAYDAMGRPLVQGAGQKFQQYVANPFAAGRDIAASKVMPGTIPAQVARQAAPEIRQQVGKIASTSPLTTSPITGGRYPESVPDYRSVQRMAGPELGQKMTDAYAKGGNRAVLEMLDADPAARSLMQRPEFAEAMAEYRGKVPQSGMQQLGRVAGLVGRTAARFAGPVGVGMAAYDLYQLGKYGYDQYQRSQQAQPPAAPVAPAQTGAVDFETDRRIREAAAQRVLQGQ